MPSKVISVFFTVEFDYADYSSKFSITQNITLITWHRYWTRSSANARWPRYLPQVRNILPEKARSLQLLLLDRLHKIVTSCCLPVVTTSLSSNVSEILPLFQCTWLPVTLRSPPPLTVMFKSQSTCAFQFTCKHWVKTRREHFLSCGYYKGLKQQKWPSVSFKVIDNRAIRQAIHDFL